MSPRLIDLLALLSRPHPDEDENRWKLFDFACRRVSERIGTALRPDTGIIQTVSRELVGLAAMRYDQTGGLVGDPQHDRDASWLFGLFGDLDAEGFTQDLVVVLSHVLSQWYPDPHLALNALGLPAEAAKTAEQQSVPTIVPPAEIGKLRIEGKVIYVRDRAVSLDFTPERTEDALAFLGVLLEDPGNWKSSSDIGRATKREGVRFDRIYKYLPNAIKSEIESNRRKGYRIRLA
jgi:hypothetical protein